MNKYIMLAVYPIPSVADILQMHAVYLYIESIIYIIYMLAYSYI